MSVETSVEIKGHTIRLVVPETDFLLKEGQPIDPAIFGLAHTQPGVLSDIIEQLRAQTGVLDNGDSEFVGHVADSLNAAIVAIGNSTEV